MSTVVPLNAHQAPGAAVVIVSEDHKLTRALATRLSAMFTAVTDSDLDLLLDMTRLHRPALIMIDARFGERLLSVVAEITVRNMGLPLLIGPGGMSFQSLRGALRAGACGYINTDVTMERVLEIAQGVLRGEAALPRSVVGDMLAEFRARPAQVIAISGQKRVRLTQREREVLALLRSGRTTTQISRQLGVSAVTIRSHIARLAHKLRVEGRAELMELRLPGLGLPPGRRQPVTTIAGMRPPIDRASTAP